MPSNSLLASEAVPSVSFQRVTFPLTVIADPTSVSPRTAWIFWYSPSGKKTFRSEWRFRKDVIMRWMAEKSSAARQVRKVIDTGVDGEVRGPKR
jgi:hypothetical protein